MYIYGRNAVFESINSGAPIEKVYLRYSEQGKTTERIKMVSKQEKIPCTVLDNKKFAELERQAVPKGENAQGVLALRRMYESPELEVFLDELDMKSRPVIAILDCINDPHNFGAIIRSAEASGVAGIIRPIRNSCPVTPAVLKTSAGALEHIPVIGVGNLSQTLDKLKNAGFWIYGTDMRAEKSYTNNIYDRPVVIITGGEEKGLRPATRKQCDELIKIPMQGKTESLNASVSAGIIFFEILRRKLS